MNAEILHKSPDVSQLAIKQEIADIGLHEGRDQRLSSALEAIDTDVPKSLEDAEFYATGLKYLKERVSEEPEAFNEELIEELNEKSAKGLDNWRLSTEERSNWALVQGARTMKDVPRHLQSWAERSSVDGATTKVAMLSHLKTEAGQRLKLDDDITARYSDSLEQPQPSLKSDKPEANTVTETSQPFETELRVVVNRGKDGRARREDGKFISNSELAQIEAHVEQIRDGIGKHERAIGLVELDSRGLAHRENGQIMSRAEIAELNATGRKAWLKQQKQTAKDASEEALPTAEQLATSRADYEATLKKIRQQNTADAEQSPGMIQQKAKAAALAAKLAVYGAVPQAGMAVQRLREKLAAKDEQEKAKRSKFMKIGAAVLGAASLVGVIYLASRGYDTSAGDHLAGGDVDPDRFPLGSGAPDALQGPVDVPNEAMGGGVDVSGAELGGSEDTSTLEILQAHAAGDAEDGHGFTHELIELAEKAHYDLTPSQSYDLYQHLEGKFGGDLFVGHGESYNMGNGDYGIAVPGQYEWRPEVIEEMAKWLEENN